MCVIDLYEHAKLKGQKLNLANLLAKPEFKQQHLAPIRALDVDHQCKLLQRVIDGELSLAELKSESSKMKQLQSLRIAFVRLTNTKSWEDANSSFPVYATDEQLLKFIHLDMKKCIPKSFSDFCLRAKNSEITRPVQAGSEELKYNEVCARIIKAKLTEVSGVKIKQDDPTFTGAQLALTSFEEVYTYQLHCHHAYIAIYNIIYMDNNNIIMHAIHLNFTYINIANPIPIIIIINI